MPEIERRRKKPVVIEVLLWDGTNGTQVDEFTGDRVNFSDRGNRIQVWNDQEAAWIAVPLGHYVAKGALREFYPLSPQAYTETTEPDEPAPGNAEVAYEQWIERRNPEEVGSNAGFAAGWHAAVTAASGWPMCPNGCGCRLGSVDADSRDCACDGLCCYGEIEVSEVFAERDRLRAQAEAGDRIIRDVLESLCRRDGLPLESTVTPGEPARNYELADRLGIGSVFGLQPQTAPDCTVCAQVGGPHGVPQTAPTAGDRITEDTKAYVATRAGTFVTGSLVQRHVRIGFARAVTELNQMADDRLIGMPDAKGRYTVPHVPATPEATR